MSGIWNHQGQRYLTLMIPDPRHISISIMPYMLAGTGSGSSSLSISPANDIMSIIPNCLMYFKLTPSFFLCFLRLTARRKLVLPIYYDRFFLLWQVKKVKCFTYQNRRFYDEPPGFECIHALAALTLD